MSAVASHSNFIDRGFRLRDMRFVYELFVNWLDSVLGPETMTIHNTQVQRFMKDLCKDGFAKSSTKGGQARFQVTRMGLLELLQRLTEREPGNFTSFYFTYYFLKTYGLRIQQMIEAEGSGYAKSLQLELKVLLDHKRFLQKRLENVEYQIERLKVRIKETDETADFCDKLHRQGENVNSIVEQAGHKFPYALQAQKPMHVLLNEISADQRLWELTEGNRQRTQVMWKAVLEELQSQKKTLTLFLDPSR